MGFPKDGRHWGWFDKVNKSPKLSPAERNYRKPDQSCCALSLDVAVTGARKTTRTRESRLEHLISPACPPYLHCHCTPCLHCSRRKRLPLDCSSSLVWLFGLERLVLPAVTSEEEKQKAPTSRQGSQMMHPIPMSKITGGRLPQTGRKSHMCKRESQILKMSTWARDRKHLGKLSLKEKHKRQ